MIFEEESILGAHYWYYKAHVLHGTRGATRRRDVRCALPCGGRVTGRRSWAEGLEVLGTPRAEVRE